MSYISKILTLLRSYALMVFLLSPFSYLSLVAQQVQLKGVVSVQNSKTYTNQTQFVKNAEIEHINANNAKTKDITGNDGKFLLNIKGVQPNTQTQITVTMYGEFADYLVVNEKELKDITLGRLTPVSVFVCKKGDLEKRQAEMVGINMRKLEERFENDKKRMQKELDELKSKNDYLNARFDIIKDSLALINKNIDNAFEQIKEYAKKMVLENLDDRDENYVKAYQCFSRGELDSVSYYLRDDDLQKKHQKALQWQQEAKKEKELASILTESAKQKEENSENSLQEVLKEYLLLARTFEMKVDYEKTKDYYEKALNVDTANVEILFEFANYLHKIKEYAKAEKYYRKCLKIHRALEKANPKTALADIAATLNNLANLHINIQEYPNAQEEFDEALENYRILAKDNREDYLPYVATTLNNIGALHHTLKEFPKAIDEYEEALKIRRELSKITQKTAQHDLAVVLNNLGILHLNIKDYRKALEEFGEALEIYRKFVDENPKTTLPDMAMILYNLAILHKATNKYSEALEEFEEARQIYTNLADEDPKVYLSNVLTTLNNLTNIYGQLKDYAAAINYTNRANELLIKFQNEFNFKPRIAQNYSVLSWYYLLSKEFVQSEQAARQSIELNNASFAVTNLAHALLFQNRFSEAEKIYKELSKTVYKNNETFSQTLLEDMETLENESVIPESCKENVEKIRKMLKQAQQKE